MSKTIHYETDLRQCSSGEEQSIDIWRRAAGTRDLTIRELAGCTHAPTLAGADTPESISPDYTSALLAWLAERITVTAGAIGEPYADEQLP